MRRLCVPRLTGSLTLFIQWITVIQWKRFADGVVLRSQPSCEGPSMSSMWQGYLADTDYFEIRSSGGHDYGVWVTTPPGYNPATAPAPVVHVLDGNFAVGLTAPLIVTQMDPMQRIKPYIQVSVGYAGEEAQDWDRLRNRDFVPPASLSPRSSSMPWRWDCKRA